MSGAEQILGAIVILWLLGFGLSLTTRIHGRYLGFTKKLIVKPLRALWRRYRTQIIWFAVGAATAFLLFRSYAPQ